MTIGPCTNLPPPKGVVIFNPSIFTTLYPEFLGIAQPMLQFNFDRATLQLNNTCQSRVQNAVERQVLLGLLTAHITFLTNGTNTGGSNPIISPPPGVVGRIANASEGSVSVGAEFDMSGNPSQAYYVQTKYGTEYWQATAKYRQPVYVAAPCYGGFRNGFGPGYGGPGFGGPC
jgi:Protein of unknown function (DUF4054)